MSWTQALSKILGSIPFVLAAVNLIHAEKDTASKTQIAQQVLQVATADAHQVLSAENAQIADAASAAVASAIAATQAIHDAATDKPQPAPLTP
jgi:hypothetical protein